MQDKEFDKLFNSKFEDFEVEPSETVWSNIADELDGKKGKRSIMPYLSIAATVLVILTAGVLFLQKQNKPVAQQSNTNNLAANKVKQTIPVTKAPVAVVPVIKPSIPVQEVKPVERVASVNHQPKTIAPVNKITVPVVTKPEAVVNKVEQPVKPDNQQVIAAVTGPATTNVRATVPDVQLSPKSTDVIARVPEENPALMPSNEKAEQAPVKKRGIRSLGGLINVLIAKIDKREDKLIEFTDNDDDDTESSVTGVNLGVVKIKKQ